MAVAAVDLIDAAAHTAQPIYPLLETPRLLLRPTTADDVRYLHEAFADPETMRFMDFPVARNLADSARYLSTYLFVLPEWHATWALVCRETGVTIGFANYHHRENWNQRLEIGFLLHPAFRGRGLMSEALDALLAFCFEELEMERIEVTTQPENDAAIRLIERYGFRCEGGPLRRRQRVGDEFRDLSIYALLRDEWRAPRADRP
jgi:ribosomal-protein-alanine N-acetyltransferase